MNKVKITCILPVYNERGRVERVLEELVRIPEIEEIICVDESSDGSELVVKNYPKVMVRHYEKRLGKTEAVRRGLKWCKTRYVLLFDSDYIGFDREQLRNGIIEYARGMMDMLVFRQADNARIYQFLKLDLTVSGERILKTNDLRKILLQPAEGYQLEMHINHFFQNKSVYWMPLKGNNVFKFLRRGWWGGTKDGWRMLRETLTYGGVLYYLQNVLNCNWSKWESS